MVKFSIILRSITLAEKWLSSNFERADSFPREKRESLDAAKQNLYKFVLSISQLYPKEFSGSAELLTAKKRIKSLGKIR